MVGNLLFNICAISAHATIYWPFSSLDQFFRSPYFRIYELVVLEIVLEEKNYFSCLIRHVLLKNFVHCVPY